MKDNLLNISVAVIMLLIIASGCGEPAPRKWSNARLVAGGLDHPSALISDAETLYFVTGGTIAARNEGTNNLMKMPLSGGKPEILFKGGDLIPETSALAIDESHVYFSANGLRRIPKKGGDAELIASVAPVSQIVTDVDSVYWIPFVGEGMVPGHVSKAPKKGGQPVNLTGPRGGAHGLCVDEANVYWIERNGIHRVPKQGGASESIFSAATDRPVGSLRLDSNDFYFLEGDSPKRLMKLPKAGGQPVEITKNVSRFWIGGDSIIIERFVTSFSPALLRISKTDGSETELDRDGYLAGLYPAGSRIFISDVTSIQIIGH